VASTGSSLSGKNTRQPCAIYCLPARRAFNNRITYTDRLFFQRVDADVVDHVSETDATKHWTS